MGYKCSFLDNQAYTAQDVNDIFARISNGGVVFTDTGYTLSDLNDAQASAVSGGVSRDENSCRVVLEKGVYKISKGACFMDDGSAIIFDSDGYEIEILPKTTNYVYLYRNTVGNSIDVVVSEYAGGEGCVPLAEVDYKGRVYDRRKYAKAKVDLCTQGKLRNITVNFSQCTPTKSETVTVDMGSGDFSYVIFWSGERIYIGDVIKCVANSRNLIELAEGEEVSLSTGKYEGNHMEYVRFIKNGQYLDIYLKSPIPNADYTMNMGII